MLRIGTAVADITPPVGTPLDGYGGRTDVSLGVHDPLYARVLYIDDGAGPIVLAVCDLVGVGSRLVQEARDLIARRPGIPPGRVLISATHTHAGPAGVRGAGDPALIEVIARKLAGAVLIAERNAAAAHLKYAATQVESVSQNRRHPDWPIDPRLDVIAADRPDGTNIATAVRYSCHATVMERENLDISADYPGAVCQTIERVIGATTALFFNGCCGNVNPAWIRQEFDDVHRIGSLLGARAASLSQELRPLGLGLKGRNIRWEEITEKPAGPGLLATDGPIRAATRHVAMPHRTGPSDAQMVELIAMLEQQMREATSTEARRNAAAGVTRARMERIALARIAGRGETRDEEVQAFSVGNLHILGLPGEVFVETQEEIRSRSGLENLVVIAYANGYPGYFCRPEAYDQGGYEAGVTPFAPEAEPLLVAGALEVLREVS